VSRILDPKFKYRPSFETDVRKTFERVRRELREREARQAERDAPAKSRVVVGEIKPRHAAGKA
jgi:hypothetical protein